MVTNVYLILREEKVMRISHFFSNALFALERKISLIVHCFKLVL